MSLRVGRAREAEDGRCGDGDADAVRDDGLRCDVARMPVAFILAADGVAHAVAQVHSGIAKADAGQGGGEQHLRLGFGVVGIANGAGKVLHGGAKSLHGEYVRDGVRPLIGRTDDGILGARPAFRVGNRRP